MGRGVPMEKRRLTSLRSVLLQYLVRTALACLLVDDAVQPADLLGQVHLFHIQGSLAALDPAHIQDIIDQGKQETGRNPNLGDTVFHLFIIPDGLGRNGAHPDDGIHGGADFMAHPGKEIRLGCIGLLCGNQRRRQVLLLPLFLARNVCHIRAGHTHTPQCFVDVEYLEPFYAHHAGTVPHLHNKGIAVLLFQMLLYVLIIQLLKIFFPVFLFHALIRNLAYGILEPAGPWHQFLLTAVDGHRAVCIFLYVNLSHYVIVQFGYPVEQLLLYHLLSHIKCIEKAYDVAAFRIQAESQAGIAPEGTWLLLLRWNSK